MDKMSVVVSIQSRNKDYKTCITCDKIFYRNRDGSFRWKRRKYCSTECIQRIKPIVEKRCDYPRFCIYCGIMYLKKTGESFFDFGVRRYCSRECVWKADALYITRMRTKSGSNNSQYGKIPWNKNKPWPQEVRDKISQARLGEKHERWMGGCTALKRQLQALREFQQWKDAVRRRDGYRCIQCGKTSPLHIHHIKPFYLIVLENNLKTIDDAKRCIELWDINNGQTLCDDCHRKTDTYAIIPEKLDRDSFGRYVKANFSGYQTALVESLSF